MRNFTTANVVAGLAGALWTGSGVLVWRQAEGHIPPPFAMFTAIVAAAVSCVWMYHRLMMRNPYLTAKDTAQMARRLIVHPQWTPDLGERATVIGRKWEGRVTPTEGLEAPATIRLAEFRGRATVEGVDTKRVMLSQIPAALLGQIFRLGVEGEKNRRERP